MAGGAAGNTQIVMLGLRNRSRAATGWNNDTVKLEHTGPEGGPVEVESEIMQQCGGNPIAGMIKTAPFEPVFLQS